LTGALPSSIIQWTNLEGFFIYGNDFSSKLPEGIGQWSKLEFFQINDNDFTGTFPQSTTEWTSLTSFLAGVFYQCPSYQCKNVLLVLIIDFLPCITHDR